MNDRCVTGPLYFGCIDQPGHYLWDDQLQKVNMLVRKEMKWLLEMDGLLPPQHHMQIEGEAMVHHIHGRTIMAFWDRSVDSRPGSNSLFIVRGIKSFNEMYRISRETFPSIFARLGFPIRFGSTLVA